MIAIDGSFGEGGGQILRSSLALSLCTGKPFRIENIRAGRERPGLMRQHLTAVRAAARVGAASVVGDDVGSLELEFTPGTPGRVAPGEYRFAVGTAGSATLVLQTVLPALLTAGGPTTLTLEGGTHNPFAPPFDFLAKAFLPLVNRMGPRVTARLERPGFFPAGGGRFTVTIEPCERLRGFELCERGELKRRRARAVVAGVPLHVAERELSVVERKLGWPADCLVTEEVNDSVGPGNILMLELEYEHVTEVFTGFGERQRSAEAVADAVVARCKDYMKSTAPVGEHLTDQLMLPLAISAMSGRGGSNSGGAYRSTGLSRHATTHIELIRRFLGVSVKTAPAGPDGDDTLIVLGAG